MSRHWSVLNVFYSDLPYTKLDFFWGGAGGNVHLNLLEALCFSYSVDGGSILRLISQLRHNWSEVRVFLPTLLYYLSEILLCMLCMVSSFYLLPRYMYFRRSHLFFGLVNSSGEIKILWCWLSFPMISRESLCSHDVWDNSSV